MVTEKMFVNVNLSNVEIENIRHFAGMYFHDSIEFYEIKRAFILHFGEHAI